jgi:1-deoxy-D-xylulose-5-phosphate reductoisomerase
MRTPIAYGLAYPERIESGSAPLDFLALGALTFEAPDPRRFPCLALAYAALRAGAGAPATLNAANEVAVEAFLDERLSFVRIAEVIEETLARTPRSDAPDLDGVLALDRAARRVAAEVVQRFAATVRA